MLKRGSEAVATAAEAEGAPVALRTLARRAFAQPVEEGPATLPEMPSVDSAPEPHPVRDPKLPAVPDLSGKPRLVLLIGPSAGKTTFARLVVSDLAEAGRLAGTLVCAADPGPRTLAKFLPKGGVNVPASTSDRDGAVFWRDVFAEVESPDRPALTLADCGAGNTTLLAHLAAAPDQFTRLEALGVSVAVLWFFTPRTDDLAVPRAWRERGLKPTAQATVLNLARAKDGWPSFEPLRAQPDYRAMQSEGAGEVWFPALEEAVALEVERKAIPFSMARDGKVPKGRDPKTAVDGDAATAVSLWMPAARDELAPIRTWLS